MGDVPRVPRIGETRVHRVKESDPLIDFPQQENASIGREPTAVEIRYQLPTPDT
jgi:hypothetical protein